MVRAARRAIEHYFETGEIAYFKPPTEKLLRPGGAFTTIKTYPKGELRGCIGYPEPIKPLYKTIPETAILAATDDPRFPPLRPEELPKVTIEVSALTPPRRLDVPKEELPRHIKVGRDGLIIRYGPHSGLLLPQVAVEEGWNEEEFLAYTALKAGLPPDAWMWPETEVYVFQAEVFAEERPNGPVRRVM